MIVSLKKYSVTLRTLRFGLSAHGSHVRMRTRTHGNRDAVRREAEGENSVCVKVDGHPWFKAPKHRENIWSTGWDLNP